ncbi:hypothetical protein [uncultured Methylobacterium sp.]|uniref:hypothetical protein n=1 Tax=uncultured Methylobacterium sp. TaxID=157278 RepID=UPI00261F50FB|nr:hypothetical protein [uncultured Methylobacterium sp.]
MLTVAAGNEYSACSMPFFAPGYNQDNLELCIPNFFVDQEGTWAKRENQVPNERLIEGVTVIINGVRYPAKYNGQTSFTMSATTPYVWVQLDPTVVLPANGSMTVVVADYVAIGSRRPACYRPTGTVGDRITYGASSQAAFLASGTPGTPQSGSYMPNVCAIVGKPVAGSNVVAVPLVLGDSQANGNNEDARNATDRGVYSFVYRALDHDTPGVGRFAYGSMVVPGTALSNLSSAAGEFAIRQALLAEKGNPFTMILSEMGGNSVGIPGGLAASKNDLHAAIAFERQLAQGKLLVHTNLGPRSNGSTDLFTTLENQSTNPIDVDGGTDAIRWPLSDYILSLSGGLIDDVINVAPAFHDTARRDKWRPIQRFGTLTANAAVGTASITLDFKPEIYDPLVFATNYSVAGVRVVTSVTGTGPYTVGIRSPISGSDIPAGTVVRVVSTDDGLHASTPRHIEASMPLIAAKEAGRFARAVSSPSVPQVTTRVATIGTNFQRIECMPNEFVEIVVGAGPRTGAIEIVGYGGSAIIRNGNLGGYIVNVGGEFDTLTIQGVKSDASGKPAIDIIGINATLINTLILDGCRLTGVTGLSAGTHGDCLQIRDMASVKSLKVKNTTLGSAFQAIIAKYFANGVGCPSVELENVNIFNEVAIRAATGQPNSVAVIFVGQNAAPMKVKIINSYMDWITGYETSYQGNVEVTGAFIAGRPPGGDFVAA